MGVQGVKSALKEECAKLQKFVDVCQMLRECKQYFLQFLCSLSESMIICLQNKLNLVKIGCFLTKIRPCPEMSTFRPTVRLVARLPPGAV